MSMRGVSAEAQQRTNSVTHLPSLDLGFQRDEGTSPKTMHSNNVPNSHSAETPTKTTPSQKSPHTVQVKGSFHSEASNVPKVSVICIVYNSMRFLPRTVESVLAQTFTDFELVIVDDGSSDNVVEWISTLSDPRIRLISQANKGIAGARNTGIEHSRGEYLAFLDGDDLWEETKVAKQVQCLESRPEVGLVNCLIQYIDVSDSIISEVVPTKGDGEVWKDVVIENPVRCGSVPMVRRGCFKEVGLFDSTLKLAEDWDMWIRIAKRHHFALINERLVFYRRYNESISAKYRNMVPFVVTVIERAFSDGSRDYSNLKARAFSHNYRHFAWLALAAQQWQEAKNFHQQAIKHDPGLRFTKNSLLLSLHIARQQLRGGVQ